MWKGCLSQLLMILLTIKNQSRQGGLTNGTTTIHPTGTTVYNPEKAFGGYTIFQAAELGAMLIDFAKDVVLEIMKRDFEFNLFIIKSLSIKSRMLASQLEDTCLRNTLQSVCRILHSLCCYEVKGNKDQGDVVIDLSQQELANMLSSIALQSQKLYRS